MAIFSGRVTLYPVPKTLEQALAHANAWYKPPDGIDRSMNPDLSLTNSNLKGMDVGAVLKKIFELFVVAEHPNKLRDAKRIVTILRLKLGHYVTKECDEALTKSIELWEKNRVKHAPKELSTLQKTQHLISVIANTVECGAEAFTARQQLENNDRIKTEVHHQGKLYRLCGSNREVVLDVLKTGPGFALLMRLPSFFDDSVDYGKFSPEDREFLRKYLSMISHDPNHYAQVLYNFLNNCETLKRYAANIVKIKAPFEEVCKCGGGPLLQAVLPSILELFMVCTDGYAKGKASSSHPQFRQFLYDQQCLLKTIYASRVAFLEAYRTTHEEFETLKKKHGSTDTTVFPTPDAFADLPWGIKTIELLESPPPREPVPDGKDSKPKDSAAAEKVATPAKSKPKAKSTDAVPVSLSPTPPATPVLVPTPALPEPTPATPPPRDAIEHKGVVVVDAVKRTSAAPLTKEVVAKKPSIFANRVFPFKKFLYDKRVSDGRGDWMHDFTRRVDSFVGTEYSQIKPYPGKPRHTRFVIPAEVDCGLPEPLRGPFGFTFDENGVCYHRYFEPKSEKEIVSSAIYDAHYPTLQKSHELHLAGKTTTEAVIDDEFPYDIDPLETVSFRDPINNWVIRLCKPGRRA